jgi:hypothetical protein
MNTDTNYPVDIEIVQRNMDSDLATLSTYLGLG